MRTLICRNKRFICEYFSGTDAVGFDPGRGLIYIANGGANGSLTVIRQDVTDTYAVIQDLPTRQRARTLAVNFIILSCAA